jgi:hypothetical protein
VFTVCKWKSAVSSFSTIHNLLMVVWSFSENEFDAEKPSSRVPCGKGNPSMAAGAAAAHEPGLCVSAVWREPSAEA